MKNNYLTSIAINALIGKNMDSNGLAKSINPLFKGALLEKTDNTKIITGANCKPVSRNKKENHDIIFDLIKSYGAFLSKDSLKKELIIAKNIDEETASNNIKAVLANKRQFFSVNKKWGISDFLLNIEKNNDEDVIYRNYISKEELDSVGNYFKNADFSSEEYAKIIYNILNENNIEKVSLKTALYYIWLDNKSLFDCQYILSDIDKSKEIILLGEYLYPIEIINMYNKELEEESKSLNDITFEFNDNNNTLVEEQPIPIKINKPSEKEAEPLSNSIELYEDDKDNIIKYIDKNYFISLDDIINEYYEDLNIPNKKETIFEYLKDYLKDHRIEQIGEVWCIKVEFQPEDKDYIIELIKEKENVSSEYIISEILGVTKKHPKFNDLSKDIENLLADSTEVSYLGNFQWGLPLDIPEEATTIPSHLLINEITPTENAEGDIFDQELSIDGFEGTLRSDIYNSLCEDVFDEEPNKTIYSITTGKQKCVLKYHHKISGTFPLCQIPPDFFTQKTEVFPITIFNDEGIKKTAYVNNNNRIILGLNEFYDNITDVSGRIFYLEKTSNSNEYKFVLGETEKACHIDTNRSLELLEIKNRLESENLTLFDIICEILEKRPIDFIQIVTELNLVKRVSRLMIASVLSSYHCFNHNKKNGKWNLDSKKIDLGFNKTKKKYIKK